jgi:hypothetical protein
MRVVRLAESPSLDPRFKRTISEAGRLDPADLMYK